MLGKKKKVYEPYRNLPEYCKFDGRILLNKKPEITKEWFDEKTGKKIVRVRYGKYCPDWQNNRQYHTEQSNLIDEYEDGTPTLGYYWW